MNKIKDFFKRETVLCISAVLAILSVPAVKPSMEYLGYIDFKTLSLLFCLMAVMAGLRRCGFFGNLADGLLEKTKTTKQVALILILLCFFSSMLITNDIALITFVPFTLDVLKRARREKDIAFVVVMQTIAANLGSMLTPMGNPQNLYLYSLSGMTLGDFVLLMLPYALVSLVLLLVFIAFMKSSDIEYHREKCNVEKGKALVYLALFALCLLTVAGVVSHNCSFVVAVLVVGIVDFKIFGKIDYSLLFTFIFFFVFIGNMGNLEWFRDGVAAALGGRELVISILSSQVISNVPAAVLLSGFTQNLKELVIGTNLGGLGTMIASMASLISYKLFVSEFPEEKKSYFLKFTVWNLIFLAILITFHIIKYA